MFVKWHVLVYSTTCANGVSAPRKIGCSVQYGYLAGFGNVTRGGVGCVGQLRLSVQLSSISGEADVG
jgi:hypothetical protein